MFEKRKPGESQGRKAMGLQQRVKRYQDRQVTNV